LRKETWLIIEPTFYGHHYTYLENIIVQAFQKNISLIIATQNNKEGDLIAQNIFKKFENPPIILFHGKMPYLNNVFKLISLFLHEINVRLYYKSIFEMVIKSHKIDHIFLPYIDDFTFSLSLFGSPFGDTTFSGISMRQQFHLDFILNSSFDRFILKIKKYLYFRLLQNIKLINIFIIDPKLKDFIEFSNKNISQKIKYFADPVNNLKLIKKNISREILSIPDDNLVVLLFGYLDQRKGVDILIKWAIENNKNSPITIMLIGTQSPEVKNLLSSINDNYQLHIIVKDEFVPETLEGLYFSAADIVWVAYPNFLLMSSVLVKAAQAESSVIYYDVGLISYFANKYGSTLPETSFFIKKGFILNNGLRIKSFSSSNNSFVLDHTWKNAGNIFLIRNI
jgi:hypothetical protein